VNGAAKVRGSRRGEWGMEDEVTELGMSECVFIGLLCGELSALLHCDEIALRCLSTGPKTVSSRFCTSWLDGRSPAA
jgi:hypothetical protein